MWIHELTLLICTEFLWLEKGDPPKFGKEEDEELPMSVRLLRGFERPWLPSPPRPVEEPNPVGGLSIKPSPPLPMESELKFDDPSDPTIPPPKFPDKTFGILPCKLPGSEPAKPPLNEGFRPWERPPISIPTDRDDGPVAVGIAEMRKKIWDSF